jgi:hypothetical protein
MSFEGHINQDLARYELHRVWQVEGDLKPDTSHIYKKRVFFMDEDSWQIVRDGPLRQARSAVALDSKGM